MISINGIICLLNTLTCPQAKEQNIQGKSLNIGHSLFQKTQTFTEKKIDIESTKSTCQIDNICIKWYDHSSMVQNQLFL